MEHVLFTLGNIAPLLAVARYLFLMQPLTIVVRNEEKLKIINGDIKESNTFKYLG